MKINKENFETFFLLYVDNELEESERKEVEEFVKDNPQLKKSLDDLCSTVQQPEPVSMPQKSLLMHPAGASGYLVFARYAAAAIFAGLVVWVGISLLSGDSAKDQNITTETVAVKRNPSTPLQVQPSTESDSVELASGSRDSEATSSQVRKARPTTGNSNLALRENSVKKTNEIQESTSQKTAEIAELAVSHTDQPDPVTVVPDDVAVVPSQPIGDPGVKSLSGYGEPLQLTIIEENKPPVRNIRVEIIRENIDNEELAGTEHVVLGIPAEEFKKGKLGKFINKTAKILDQGNPINKLLSKN